MELVFNEIYYNDGIKKASLEIDYDKEEKIDNINYNFKNNHSLYIDINNNCLNNFNIIAIINKIFDVFRVEYIDKDIWQRFLKYEENEHKKNSGTKMNYNCPTPYIAFEDEYFKTLNSYKTKILDKINEDVINKLYTNCHKIICYDVKFYSDKEYCYYLLHILFNSNFNFKIKKCKQCKQPFVTYNQNFDTCTRIFKNDISCNKYYEKIRKQHQYDDPIKKLEKRVRSKLEKDKINLYNQFIKELPIKREKYYNDNKSFINWILNNYYFTEKGRNKVIEELNLSKYL